MTTINPYLHFDGNCEQAFSFYHSVFGGTLSKITRFNDFPSDIPLTAEEGKRVLHVLLPINPTTTLIGSDQSLHFDPELKVGNNVSIAVNVPSEEEAQRLFSELSDKGTITTPLEKTFWGAWFGMFTDQFGIHWMISHDNKA